MGGFEEILVLVVSSVGLFLAENPKVSSHPRNRTKIYRKSCSYLLLSEWMKEVQAGVTSHY